MRTTVLLLVILLTLMVTATPVHAQILQCPRASDVQGLINTISTFVLLSIVMIIVFLIVFNFLGIIATLAMRVAEFFMERIRFAFEMMVVYFLFLYRLAEAIESGEGGCARVHWDTLLSSGPIFFQILGAILDWMGLR